MYNDEIYKGSKAAEVKSRALALVAPWGVEPHSVYQSRIAQKSELGCTEFQGWEVAAPIPNRPDVFVILDLEKPLPELAVIQAAPVEGSNFTPVKEGPYSLPVVAAYEGHSWVCTPKSKLA